MHSLTREHNYTCTCLSSADLIDLVAETALFSGSLSLVDLHIDLLLPPSSSYLSSCDSAQHNTCYWYTHTHHGTHTNGKLVKRASKKQECTINLTCTHTFGLFELVVVRPTVVFLFFSVARTLITASCAGVLQYK